MEMTIRFIKLSLPGLLSTATFFIPTSDLYRRTDLEKASFITAFSTVALVCGVKRAVILVNRLSFKTDLYVEESQCIIPGVLSVEVSHCDFVHVDVPGLAKLRSSIRSTETPAQAPHRSLLGDLTVDDGDVHRAQPEDSPGLTSPPDSLEQNPARLLEEIGRSQGLATTLGLDSDEVALLVVGSDVRVGQIEGPESLISSGDLVGVGPTYLGVVNHNYLRTGIVHKFP